MDQKRVEGDELLRGVANRMNKLFGKGEVATKHQRVAARVLNPRSSIDQHGQNNDGVQPRVFENPIAYGGPRVSESSKQNGSNDLKGNMQSQFGGSEPIGYVRVTPTVTGLSKSDSVLNPTSIGESWTVNPSRECVIEVEEGASLAEGDGISVSRMAGSFVLKDPKLDVNNIDATTEVVANERSYTSLGESTIRSTMNPSCGSKSDVEEGIWSTKDPLIRPTRWNLTINNNVPTKHDDDAPITQSVDINSTPNSYAGAAGTNKVIQPKEQANFRPMSLGQMYFARCLIEINSEAEFTESITIGIPELEGPGGFPCPKKCEYFPFEHSTNTNTPNDGFQQVVNKRRNNKKNTAGNTIPRGVPVAKGFQVGKQFNYQPKAPKTNSDGGSTREATSSKVGSSSYSNEGASTPAQTVLDV
ncbi:hypothetical protein Tco_0073790 [Tanacetum coccineum]